MLAVSFITLFYKLVYLADCRDLRNNRLFQQKPKVAVTVAALATSNFQGASWSWKVMEFRKTIFQAGKSWKIAKVMESHGK